MEAIVGVWLTSLLGATAFSAAGYVLGQRGVVLPFLGLPEGVPAKPAPLPAQHPTASLAPKAGDVSDGDRPTPDFGAPERTKPDDATLTEIAAQELSRARGSKRPSLPTGAPSGATGPSRPPSGVATLIDEDDEETLAKAAAAKAGGGTNPGASVAPPTRRVPSVRPAAGATDIDPQRDLRLAAIDLETTKAELQAAIARAEAATQQMRAAEVVRSELERQLEALRLELRQELVARATAEKRVEELGDRLASASEEAASLRHKFSTLDKQSRQLRDALQGRVRALTTSEWHRRRDLEDADEMRVKLHTIYDKIEKSSSPPPGTTPSQPAAPQIPEFSQVPQSSFGSAPPARGGRAGDDSSVLRDEIVRLTTENRALRARALGSMPPKQPPSRGSAPDLDLDVYRTLIDRMGSIAGLRGAVVADELGSLLVGSGELAEGLAAFGAYIRDASARTDRLLPLEGVEEVDIRDRAGIHLCTRVLTHSPSELSLVLLGAADTSIVAAKKIAEETLRAR